MTTIGTARSRAIYGKKEQLDREVPYFFKSNQIFLIKSRVFDNFKILHIFREIQAPSGLHLVTPMITKSFQWRHIDKLFPLSQLILFYWFRSFTSATLVMCYNGSCLFMKLVMCRSIQKLV